MAINKVVYGNNTLIDLTEDTVSADKLLAGETAHDRSGAPVVGSVVAAEVVDNLTTQDSTKALSANQGYVLNQNKVDKVTGKGLSTNDYTNEEKTKLAGISAGAEPNVQSDWKQSDSSSNDFIKNKPTSDVQTSDDGQFTTVTGGLMQSCVVDLEPIQDLHGYSKPWVGGSGKNKLPLTVDNVKSTSTAGTWSGNKYTINGVTYELFANEDGAITSIKATGKATANAPLVFVRNYALANGNYTLSGCPSNGSDSTYIMYSTGVSASDTDTGTGAQFSISSGKTISVAIMIYNGYTIPTGGLTFYPQIESGSTKTSFEPYTNICPISGHTQVQVGNVGKNKWDEDYTNYDGTVGSNPINYYRYVRLKANTQYTLSSTVPQNNTQGAVLFIASGKTYSATTSANGVWNNNPRTITTDADGYVTIVWKTQDGISPSNYPVQLEEGSSATEYEPYNGYTVTINLGGTYYGGTLDAVSGVLTVTHGFKDLGTLTYTAQTNISSFYATLSDAKTGAASTTMNAICSQYSVVQTKGSIGETMAQGDAIFAMMSGSQLLFIKDTSKSSMSASDFKTAMSGVQLCYELATPTTIQLDPQTLETLVGQNDVFAPLVGQTVAEVEYREVLAFEDVPKAIPYENVAPDVGTDETHTYFRIHRYGRVVVFTFMQDSAIEIVEQATRKIFGVLPERFYTKVSGTMPYDTIKYTFINQNRFGVFVPKLLEIDPSNGNVYADYEADEGICPMGSLTYILDHD